MTKKTPEYVDRVLTVIVLGAVAVLMVLCR